MLQFASLPSNIQLSSTWAAIPLYVTLSELRRAETKAEIDESTTRGFPDRWAPQYPETPQPHDSAAPCLRRQGVLHARRSSILGPW